MCSSDLARLRGRELTGTRTQDLDFSHQLAYVAVRARAAWQRLAIDLDYALAPEALAIGGDVDGVSHDFEARLSYQLPQGDMSFFAGYRRNDVGARGDADGLDFASDLVEELSPKELAKHVGPAVWTFTGDDLGLVYRQWFLAPEKD